MGQAGGGNPITPPSLLGQEAASGIMNINVKLTYRVYWVNVVAVESEGQVRDCTSVKKFILSALSSLYLSLIDR